MKPVCPKCEKKITPIVHHVIRTVCPCGWKGMYFEVKYDFNIWDGISRYLKSQQSIKSVVENKGEGK
jgi:hypothetical protein